MNRQTAEIGKRIVIYPKELKDLIAEFGRYDLITPAEWSRWDREQAAWRQRHRADQCAIYILPDGSIDNPHGIDLTGTPYVTAAQKKVAP
jgi:hypothetical protein